MTEEKYIKINVEDIKFMLGEGMTTRDIARQLGVSHLLINEFINKNELLSKYKQLELFWFEKEISLCVKIIT